MPTITLRQANVVNSPDATIKGSPLSNSEVDNNFANLNLGISDLSNTVTNLSSSEISNGTSNVSILTVNGSIVISANFIPNVGNVINLGSDTNRFNDLFLSGNTINLGGDTISSVGGFIKINNNNVFTTTGNIASANIDATSITTGTLPVVRGGTGITSLGTGVATFLGTPSSSNLATAISDETGSGALVFANSPTLVGPALGTPISGTLTNCSFPTLNQNTTGSAATLTTPRAINGTNFNGSAAITITAAATNTATQLLALGVGTAASGTTGEIRATNNVTAFFSDRRLKTGITQISDALNKLCGITGVTFQSNDTAAKYGYTNQKVQVGVIAQEVEKVLPQVVFPAPFDIGQNEDGTEYSLSGENYMTVQYEKLIPLLIEAIKELKAEVDQLKNIKG